MPAYQQGVAKCILTIRREEYGMAITAAVARRAVGTRPYRIELT